MRSVLALLIAASALFAVQTPSIAAGKVAAACRAGTAPAGWLRPGGYCEAIFAGSLLSGGGGGGGSLLSDSSGGGGGSGCHSAGPHIGTVCPTGTTTVSGTTGLTYDVYYRVKDPDGWKVGYLH